MESKELEAKIRALRTKRGKSANFDKWAAFHIDDLMALVTAEVERAKVEELKLVKDQYVNRLRDVYLTNDDPSDPLAEKAVAIRNNLRREISEDIDKRIATLQPQPQKGQQLRPNPTKPFKKGF